MVDVLCPRCGETTNRVYKPPYGSEEKGWMCEDCIMGLCDCAHLYAWTDEDFKRTKIEVVE